MRTSAGSVGGDESICPQRRHLVGRVLAPGLLAVGAAAVAPGVAGAATNQQVATATIAGVGRVLVFGHRVLYVHSTDTRRHSTCTGVCATIWPPLVVSSQTAHHLGHIHGLATIRRPNGRLQATINGHPLYFFSGDKNLTAAMGQGFLNMWFTVRASGKAVHVVKANSAPAAPAAPAPAPTSSTTTTQGSHSSGTQMPVSPAPTTTPPTSPPPPSTTTTRPPATTTTSPPPTTTTTAPGGGGVSF
jgi:predicted lipoprotein with Yx(FWY)xxD motif